MRPVVSIVIVAYKAREYVLRCLASVQQCVELPHETIVVDDGSADGTPQAVKRAFPRTRVIAKERNAGLAAGRNSALALVRGDYVLMLDSDTQVRPGAVEELVRVLEEHPEVGLVGPRLLNPDGTIQPSARRLRSALIPLVRRGPYAALVKNPAVHRRHMMQDFDFHTERPVVSVMGAAQLWRAELPRWIGPYDERISSYGGEDIDWCMRVWGAGLAVRFVPSGEVTHEWQHVVRKRRWSRQSARALRDWYYVWWKHRRLRRDRRIAAANA